MCKQDLKHFDIEKFAESIEERIEEFLEDEFATNYLEDTCDICGHESVASFCSKECHEAF